MGEKKKIIIIGGGAAGFFAAANLDENQYDTIIIEQNKEVLQKVKISGGGRCNVTHGCFDPKELIRFYPRGNKELNSVFHQFQPGDTMQWFEERGVPLKIENDQRIFPENNSSQSIITALQKEIERKNTSVFCQKTVTAIEITENNDFIVRTAQENYKADFIIFTTGSSPKSLQILSKLGLNIIPPVPSLFTFNIKNSTLDGLMGTSFENVFIRIPDLKLEETGPLLVTHWGLSGPAVLKLSAWGARLLAEKKYQFEIVINFLGIEKYEAEELLKNYKTQNPKKQIGQSKIYPITQRFWQRILEISNVDSQKNISNLSQKEIQSIIERLCEHQMKVNGKSIFKEEFVTAGGVDLKEINFKTMECKKIPQFFIAGEVLNIDAVTGGFNFQACWSEAWLIAQHLNTLHPYANQ